ncbi:5,6-dimethylbenzimidazole synthase [bacterium BMS3Bbin06]|nr:5,6-dimethylbenzimidazole synthase [bacterium BMS3Abin08]GBE33623.1 5,6-dimethylbenzimidazole synthase [bacterium BMS3Bbin06]HDO35083.1 nitroreductase [Nitrospirota bacterium]HDY72528.1 nitroreductase [Nitrospirota bacterium]
MDLFETISGRRSTRRFEDRDVEEEKLKKIMDAVRQAPSWSNMQCWRFIIIRDHSLRAEISELTYVESFLAPLGYKVNPAKKGITEAPVVMIACADPSLSGNLWNQPYYMTDLGIAAQNLMLAAHALGLGTVFVGVFGEEKLKKLLAVPGDIRIVGMFPVGYPKIRKKEGPPRKELREITFLERWGNVPDWS